MKRKYTIFALIVLFTLMILFYRFYTEKITERETQKNISNNYPLINLNGSVRLYRDDILIQIYDNINPNSLPLTDRDNLNSGIKLKSVAEAQQLIEDFDG